jgi:MoaA/NifB/PqqE/SkfB family radical SAM enzyme
MEAANIAATNSRRGNINSKKACVQGVNKYPTELTFQLQNNCNYECIMCSGEYSSSICKNRDGKLPPPCVYDDAFIEKIKPFLQHAESCHFLGGEPFLIPIYYKIWDIIREINPECHVSITTNGSIYTKRIEDILTVLPNSSLVVSLDSLVPETYNYIRRRGDLYNVLSNIDKFLKSNKLKSLAVCPLIQNVYELPNFVNFCAERNLNLWINNVTDIISNPGTSFYKELYENGSSENTNNVIFKEEYINEFRLWTLPQKEKIKIKNELLSHSYPKPYQDKIISFVNFLLNYKHDTAPKE